MIVGTYPTFEKTSVRHLYFEYVWSIVETTYPIMFSWAHKKGSEEYISL